MVHSRYLYPIFFQGSGELGIANIFRAWEEVTFEEGSDEPISYMKPIPISWKPRGQQDTRRFSSASYGVN